MCQLLECEEGEEDASKTVWPHIKADSSLNPPLNEVVALLGQDLYDTEESLIGHELEKLWYWDFERLVKACTELSSKVKDPKLAVVLCSQSASMVGTLNFYLDKTIPYTWCQLSALALKAQGKGLSYG